MDDLGIDECAALALPNNPKRTRERGIQLGCTLDRPAVSRRGSNGLVVGRVIERHRKIIAFECETVRMGVLQGELGGAPTTVVEDDL